jgi:hypothetical protein
MVNFLLNLNKKFDDYMEKRKPPNLKILIPLTFFYLNIN